MMCPDNGAIDHVSASIPLDQFGQGFQHRLEHAGLDPSPVTAKDAVPFAIFVRQMSPLRSGARHPHHAFEIAAIVLCRATATPSFSGKKGPDQRPFLICHTYPFAQGCLQIAALNQNPIPQSTFVHET